MSYPATIDSFETWVDKNLPLGIIGTLILAEHYNDHSDAILAIEETIGTDPLDGAANLSARIAAVESNAQLWALVGNQ